MFKGYLVSNLFRLKSLIYFDKLMAALESSYQKIEQTFYETLYFTSRYVQNQRFFIIFYYQKTLSSNEPFHTFCKVFLIGQLF